MDTETHDTAFDPEAMLAELDADEPSPDESDVPSDAEPQADEPQAEPAQDDDDADAVPADAPTEPPDDAQGDTPPADPATPDTPAVEPEPFAFTADGKRVAVEGAVVEGDTIRVSKDAWLRHVQPHLADRTVFARERQAFEQQLKARSVREQQSEQLVQMLQDVAGKPEDELIEWALGLKQQMPMLLKDAEIAALKAQSEPLRAQVAEHEQQVTEQQVADWLTASVHAYLDTPQFNDLKGDTRFVDRATRMLRANVASILYEKPGADGQPTIDAHWDKFQAILADEAADRREFAAQSKRIAAFEAAAKANAKSPSKQVPPAVSTTGRPTGPAKQPPVPTTKDEMYAVLDQLATGDL